MTPFNNELRRLLERLECGELQADDERLLESLIASESPESLAQAVGARAARPDPALRASAHALEAASVPTEAQWERVWAGVHAARPSARRWTPRVLRLWRASAAAAAACLALAALWGARVTAAPEADWPVRLATNVEIHALDVGEDSTSFLVSLGDDGARVIWVLPGEG